MKDRHSYHLGEYFFFVGVYLALPLVTVIAPLWVLSMFTGLDMYQLIQYWRILGGLFLLAFILCIWVVSPLLRNLFFGQCPLCNGAGKVKEQQE